MMKSKHKNNEQFASKLKHYQTLKDVGECSAIQQLCKYLINRPDIKCGSGDDCAVVKIDSNSNYDLLLTSDPVIEGYHFTKETPPSSIGHKAIGRVLSDIAAMGGEPMWALINIVAPPETPIEKLKAIYAGANKLAEQYNMSIVGGDMTSAPTLEIHVFTVGRVPIESAIKRSGAKHGELIFVTGYLGGSFKNKHLIFEPRIREGIYLRDWATAIIDISDGLASDLRHLINMSNTGAKLISHEIPISSDTYKINDDMTPFEHALCDGEDFELLFTLPASKEKVFLSSWRSVFELQCTLIGNITDKRNIIECVNADGNITILNKTGYEHFK